MLVCFLLFSKNTKQDFGLTELTICSYAFSQENDRINSGILNLFPSQFGISLMISRLLTATTNTRAL